MPRMKFWNGSAWIPLDAADADTVDGKHASDFAPATHVGQGGAAHALANSTTAGFMSASDFNKLAGIQPGAEVNQNAFTTIKVGSTNIDADSKTDVLELVAGSNITLTPDVINDKITISTTAEPNQNAFTTIKVGATNIDADSKTDTLELVAGTGIVLTPDATNDKVTFAVNATSAGGTEPNKIAQTNASGRVGDSEKVGGRTLSDLDNRYVPLAISSETQPSSPKEGMIWYKPSTSEAKAFLNGSFRDIAGGAFVQRTGTVTTASATNTVTVPFGFDSSKEVLLVFQNGTMINQPNEYTVNGTQIVKKNGTWNTGTVLDFVCIGGSAPVSTSYDGSLIVNGTVTNAKLHTDIKIGSLAALTTTNKSDIVSAINEVNAKSGPASNVSITDSGNYYTGTNVEVALQEIGQVLNAMRGNLITSVNNILNM